ncbi:MAG: AraC family ligand binding domain-containing protein [Candidatus Gottesmanbacteria bacterium]|nr:AraC family ligand binding domain-containing protein [Candidatus Gottesmanbacteria bacterium]
MIKIPKSNAIVHGRKGLKASYYQLPDVLNGMTLATATFTSEHGQSTIGDRPRIYYVVKGKGKFIINGETVLAASGDVIIIPPKATYNLWPIGKKIEIFLISELLSL